MYNISNYIFRGPVFCTLEAQGSTASQERAAPAMTELTAFRGVYQTQDGMSRVM